MPDLASLLSAWLPDCDGDGLADEIAVGLVLDAGLTPEVYQAAGLLAARLGLEVTAATLPICFERGEPVPKPWTIGVSDQGAERAGVPGAGLISCRQQHLQLDGNCGQLVDCLRYLALCYPAIGPGNATALDQLRQRLEQQLGIALTCCQLRVWPDRLETVWEGSPGEEFSGAVVSSELSMPGLTLSTDCGRLVASLPLDWSDQPTSGDPVNVSSIDCLSRLYHCGGWLRDSDGDCLADEVTGWLPAATASLEQAVALGNLAARLGLETLGMTLDPAANRGTLFSWELADDGQPAELSLRQGQVVLRGAAGQLSAILGHLGEQYPLTPVGGSWTELLLTLAGWARATQPISGEWQELAMEWEVDELRRAWRELISQPSIGQRLSAEARVSEPRQLREQLRVELLQAAQAAGWNDVQLLVRSAYKQGLEWIREEVLPALLNLPAAVERCLIRVAAFQGDDSALDPAARWLLELYPVDELLAQALGIDPEQVSFELVPDLPVTYQLQAFTAAGLGRECCFTVWHGAQPYLSALDARPTVHPPTGGLAWSLDREQGFRRIQTDLERVFVHYQATILPQLLETASAQGPLQAEQQPFFERLHLQINLSEPEERLGVREELISPCDALHEDLYFVGLDLFKRLGELHGQTLRSPGLILPEIRQSAGRPTLRYRVTERSQLNALAHPRLAAIQFDAHGGVQAASIDWSVDAAAMAAQVAAALRQHSAAEGLPLAVRISYPGGSQQVSCRIGRAAGPGPIERSQVVDQEQCRSRLLALSQTPGALVEVAGVSRQGRLIYRAAMTSPGQGRLISTSKLAGWKTTYLLNNRHHANEVSSSSAALDLLEQLAGDGDERELLRKVNVVAIPLENVDGAALHQQLMACNPLHKFHAARYNSLGREFADCYFQDDPRVPEAGALTETWRRFVPDIVADNHGIPSHEWEQPFSGYLCPWFASFWIPRSLFYAYFWCVDDPRSPSRRVAAALEAAITEEFRNEQVFQQRNQALLAAWRKYFLPYLADHFAGEERAGLIWYYVPSGPDASRRFASHRFPQLTVLDYTTEVADETAQGDYLGLCSRTHRLAQLACLRWLAEQPVQLIDRMEAQAGGGVYRSRRRRRPLVGRA